MNKIKWTEMLGQLSPSYNTKHRNIMLDGGSNSTPLRRKSTFPHSALYRPSGRMTADWKKKLVASTYHDEPSANFCREVVTKKNGYYWRYVLTETEWRHHPRSDIFFGVLRRGMLWSVFLCWPLVSQHRVRATEESTEPRGFFCLFFFPPIGERWWKRSIWGEFYRGCPGGGGWWRSYIGEEACIVLQMFPQMSLIQHAASKQPVNRPPWVQCSAECCFTTKKNHIQAARNHRTRQVSKFQDPKMMRVRVQMKMFLG